MIHVKLESGKMLQKITIEGYRGFKTKQEINFAIPNGNFGGGITILTGANNSGKSSIIECLKARTGHENVSFSSGKRNNTIDKVRIEYIVDGVTDYVESRKNGSSETERELNKEISIFTVPSRRSFSPYFAKTERNRDDYIKYQQQAFIRESSLPEFYIRLFSIDKKPDEFNKLLEEVLGYSPLWSIDQNEQGNYFLKFTNGDKSHSSDGLGEGIISVFAIVDALYDSQDGDIIVIDEPELSLHPSLQKRLFNLLCKQATNKQIIISTHSPYFVDLGILEYGANVIRVVNEQQDGTKIYELTTDSKNMITRLLKDQNFPHMWGLNAREIFFQEDGVILTEGQEDVVLYPLIAEQLGMKLPRPLFGWGVGGAEKMNSLAKIMQELGFKKVAGILDGDKSAILPKLNEDFSDYYFCVITADDIRTKPARAATVAVNGLLDENRKLKAEHTEPTKKLLNDLSHYMRS